MRPALLIVMALGAAPALAGTPSPADWRDQSVYQIVTDRFRDGDPSNNAVEGFYDPADGFLNHGGDWQGIEQELDYIQGLGATALWISPVQTNAYAAYHGYSIRDFYSFSAHFGGLAALQSLIDAAHARGMYVILDVIANHGGDLIDSGSPGYPAFQDPGTYTLRWRNQSLKAAPPFDDLAKYHNNGTISSYTDPEQILGELFGLDDFRTEDPGVRQELIDAHTWLVQQTDADGFRIDTVKHVELGFWQAFGPALRTFSADSLGKGNFFQFGEVFDGSPQKNGLYTGTVGGGAYALDSVLWYPMYFTSLGVFRDGFPTQWLSFVLADSVQYAPAARSRLINFLDNHDNGRFQGFQSSAERDDAKARVALTWSHTSTGIPLVYYGTEQEFDGGSDPWNREDMWDGQWDFGPSDGDNFDAAAPLYRYLRRVNELRGALPALRRGSQQDAASDAFGAGLYAYHRRLAGEDNVLVALNTSSTATVLTIDPDLPGGTVHDGLTGRSFDVPASGAVNVTVGGLSAVVLSAADPDPAPWILQTWPPHDGEIRAMDAEVRITFTEPMNPGSAASAATISPPVPFSTAWFGPTLVLRPQSPWSDGTTYEVTVDGGALASDGGSLGVPYSFSFHAQDAPGPVAVPSGWRAYELPADDLMNPLSLGAGRGPFTDRRVLLGDTGWGRIFLWNDRGMVEARFVDGQITSPSSLAQDALGGRFGGDVLFTQSNALRRCRLDGLSGGAVQTVASLPGSAPDWVIATDVEGAFGGYAYLGRSGSGSVFRADSAGTPATFASGVGGVRGLAFGPGGDLYAVGGTSVWRIGASGQVSVLASGAVLSGASSLAYDPVGSFGRNLFTTSPASGAVLQIDAAGQVSTFATGFQSFPGNDCLAFDALGDLHVLGDPGSGTTVVKIVPNTTSDSVDVPPVETGPELAIGPNPFRESLAIDFLVPSGGAEVRVSVLDVGGREVTVLEDGVLAGGRKRVAWGGRDGSGGRAAAGVYFVRIRIGERETSRKVVRIP